MRLDRVAPRFSLASILQRFDRRGVYVGGIQCGSSSGIEHRSSGWIPRGLWPLKADTCMHHQLRADCISCKRARTCPPSVSRGVVPGRQTLAVSGRIRRSCSSSAQLEPKPALSPISFRNAKMRRAESRGVVERDPAGCAGTRVIRVRSLTTSANAASSRGGTDTASGLHGRRAQPQNLPPTPTHKHYDDAAR